MQTCFKRNVHDRSLEDIQGAAACWEPAPSFYPRLDVTSLFEPSQGQQVSACLLPAGTTCMLLSLCSPACIDISIATQSSACSMLLPMTMFSVTVYLLGIGMMKHCRNLSMSQHCQQASGDLSASNRCTLICRGYEARMPMQAWISKQWKQQLDASGACIIGCAAGLGTA